MNKYINKSIAGLFFITVAAIFLSGCNNIYFKPDKLPHLKNIKANYTEIYQSTFIPKRVAINFTRNGNIAAIYDSPEIRFYDLDKNRLIKKILSPERDIDYGKSGKNGSRYLLIIDGFARILNTQNWQTIAQFKVENGVPNTPNFSDNASRLYIDDSLWNIETGEHIRESIGVRAPISSDFSDNNHYFVLADRVDGPTLVDMESKKRLEPMPVIEYSKKVLFRDNNSFYIDYGASGSFFIESLGLFSIEPQSMLAEITPYQRISCWTRLKDDKRLVMGLIDGSLLVLDENLHVLEHWNIGTKALKCIGGKNARVWIAGGLIEPTNPDEPAEESTAYNLYEVNINQKTISHPVQLEGTIEHLAVSPDGKYIALINDLPDKTLARIYLNNN